MAINRLVVKGYRSLRNVEWRPGRVNLLIGPNGAGKSNLLRALSLVRSAATGSFDDEVLRDGGMQGISWNGRGEEILLRIECDVPNAETAGKSAEIYYEIAFTSALGSSTPAIRRETLKRFAMNDNEKRIFLRRDDLRLSSYESGLQQVLEQFSPRDSSTALSAAGKFLGKYPDFQEFWKSLAGLCLLDDIRTDQRSDARRPFLARPDRVLDRDAQNIMSYLHTSLTDSPRFAGDLMDALKAAIGEDFKEILMAPAGANTVEARMRFGSLDQPQSAAMISSGILRFLILSSVLLQPTPPRIIAIDEPEASLHPRMMGLVAEMAETAPEGTQVIFATQSAEFLDAFERPPTITVCENVGGETKLATIQGEELTRWLKDFRLGNLHVSGSLMSLAHSQFDAADRAKKAAG